MYGTKSQVNQYMKNKENKTQSQCEFKKSAKRESLKT